jgi:hypothetical protein
MRLHVSLPGPFSVSFGGGYRRRPASRKRGPVNPYPNLTRQREVPHFPIFSVIFLACVFLDLISEPPLFWLLLLPTVPVPAFYITRWALKRKYAIMRKRRLTEGELLPIQPTPAEAYLARKRKLRQDEFGARTSRPRDRDRHSHLPANGTPTR